MEGRGDAEWRAVAWRVAAAIGCTQDVVARMIDSYSTEMAGRWATSAR